jgi:ABC-2 type transport system permease protein
LYVTSETTPVLYVVEGHGETMPGATFEETINKMNLTMESIKTVSAESIPQDCDILYINAPTVDFSEEEATMIKDYLASGKDLIVTLNYKAEDLENFLSVLDYYGVTMVKGIVFEGNSNMHYSNNPLYILPNVESNDITTQTSNSEIPVIMPQSSGVTSSGTTRSSLTFTPLLTTSKDSYSKEATNLTTAEKEDKDVEGPFNLGLLATDTYEGTASNLAAFGTEYTFDDGTLSYANADLLKDTIGHMIGDTAVTVSIPTKSVEAETIYPSQMQALAWGVILVILVPAAILITGIVVSIRRRKK